ncbi:hypothetical protein ACP3TJ_08610 [Desulforudis sp. 1088]
MLIKLGVSCLSSVFWWLAAIVVFGAVLGAVIWWYAVNAQYRS